MSDTPPAVVPYDDTRRPQVRALTASAVRRQITTAGKVPDEARVHRKDWQADAWSYFRSVGEISFAMFFLGDAISKLRLFVAARPDPKAPPLPADDPESGVDPTAAKLANETLDRLKGDQGGLSQLLKEMEINLEVAGELTLYGRPAAEEKTDPLSGKVLEQARPEETWEILSVSELHTDNGGRSVIVGGAGDRNGRPVAEDDIAIRMWTRDPEFSAQAFCHLRPLLDECETLQILSRDLRATGRSRLAGNGILLVPSELSFGSTDPSAPASADPFFDDLMTTMTTPIQDEGNAAAVVPLVVRGPADVLEKVRHLTLARPNDAATDIKIENRLVRIANGLNAPLEVVLSHRGCVDTETEIFTSRGWLHYDEVRAGDLTLTLNHDKGLAEVQRVEKVSVYPVVDEPMLRLHNSRHSSVTTLDHRWPVISGRGQRRWVTSADLKGHHRIVLGALSVDSAADFSPQTPPTRVANLRRDIVTLTGDVWCPTTGNGTWLARRDGLVHFTGNTTFANAKVVDQSTFDDHIEPRAVTIVDLLTHGFLRPTLLTPITDGGPPSVDAAEVAKMFIWFDATDLIGSPGQEEKVDKAHEDGVISDEARRRYLGIPETDAPSDEDILRALLRRASLDPTMTAEILGRLGVTGVSIPERAPTAAPGMTGETEALGDAVIDVDAQPVEALEPEGKDRAADLGITAAATTNTGERVGRRLMQIDRTLRTRLEVAADRAMTRALERAGAKLRAKVGRSGDLAVTVDGIPNAHVAATLGQLVVSGLGFASDDLLNGAFDDLADDCDEWIGGAQANAAGLIGRFSGATPTSLDALALRQQQGRERAREVLIGGLMLLAGQRLFDPSPAAPPLGETDASLSVPTSVLRDVLSVAGGQTPDTEDGPLWGVATGPDVMGVLSESGGGIEGYEWDYGPADRRPFPPHEDLDGVTFESPDDPVLASDGEFPETDSLWPGDHSGCAPAGTIVSGPAPRGATLRYHQGEMVTVRFASGQFLSTTPNHPILTDGGWVPSGLLHEGSDVVRCPNPERVADLIPDDHQVPARIEDVAAAFSVSEGVVARRVEIAPMNFHGDGIGSKVGVVWTDSHLRDGADAALVEPIGQPSLAGADPVGGVGLPGSGGSAKHLEGVGDAALGVVGGQGLLHTPLRAELTGGKSGGVGATTALHPGSKQALLDRSPVDAVALGDPVLGLAGQVGGDDLLDRQLDVRLGGASGGASQFIDGGSVAGQATLGQYLPKEDGGEPVTGGGFVTTEALPVCLDRVVEVEHRRFEGHVYNLQTGTGWYIADGIIIHNCVCDVAPRLLSPGESAGE